MLNLWGKGSIARARSLRQRCNDAEKIFWVKVRAHRFHGLKFRRQVPLGPYVVDFLCAEKELIVEIDGDSHAYKRISDANRDRYFLDQGWHIHRIMNNSVKRNIDGVMEALANTLGIY